jgi:hypothetical protein
MIPSRAVRRAVRVEHRRVELAPRQGVSGNRAANYQVAAEPVGHRIGAAAREFRTFEGKEDGAGYIPESTHLLNREAPAAQRPSDSSLKPEGCLALPTKTRGLLLGIAISWPL